MSGKSRAKREARFAAQEAEQVRFQLQEQERLERERRDRETARAQRLLARSLRASGGGFFETDQQNTLGGTGVLG